MPEIETTEVTAEVTTEETTAPLEETTSQETTDDWRASIEDDSLRKVADRFDSVVSLTQAVSDLRKRESNSIRIPGKDASDEDTAAYLKALGVPETVEGYEFSVPEGHELTDADNYILYKYHESKAVDNFQWAFGYAGECGIKHLKDIMTTAKMMVSDVEDKGIDIGGMN